MWGKKREKKRKEKKERGRGSRDYRQDVVFPSFSGMKVKCRMQEVERAEVTTFKHIGEDCSVNNCERNFVLIRLCNV